MSACARKPVSRAAYDAGQAYLGREGSAKEADKVDDGGAAHLGGLHLFHVPLLHQHGGVCGHTHAHACATLLGGLHRRAPLENGRTGDATHEALGREQARDAEQDLVPAVKVVKGAAQDDRAVPVDRRARSVPQG